MLDAVRAAEEACGPGQAGPLLMEVLFRQSMHALDTLKAAGWTLVRQMDRFDEHQQWGNSCDDCHEPWPCSTVAPYLRGETAQKGSSS